MDDAGGGGRGLRPSLTPELTAAVKQTWGLDLEGASPLDGSTGLNLVVETSVPPVVVRVHRRHVTAARVEALQIARETAASGGVPTAWTIFGRLGERHVTVDGCVIEVEPFVESDASMDTRGRIRQAMPMFGRLHDALASARLPEAADDLRFGNYVPATDITSRTAEGARRIRTLDVSLHQVADTAEALAHDVARAHSTIGPPLENQWCHGDYWDSNVLFRQGEIVLVADFGFMNRRPRIDDLALTLYFTLWDLDAAGHSDPRSELAALVDAYDSGTQRPLSNVEREALPIALARQPLWSIGVWAAQLDDPIAVAAHLQGHEKALQRAANILKDFEYWWATFRR